MIAVESCWSCGSVFWDTESPKNLEQLQLIASARGTRGCNLQREHLKVNWKEQSAGAVGMEMTCLFSEQPELTQTWEGSWRCVINWSVLLGDVVHDKDVPGLWGVCKCWGIIESQIWMCPCGPGSPTSLWSSVFFFDHTPDVRGCFKSQAQRGEKP